MTRAEFIATLRRDFERDPFPWDRLTIAVFRLGQYSNTDRKRRLPALILWRFLDTFYLRVCLGAELPPSVQCGPGLVLRHAGQGVIWHPDVTIGKNARIYHRVTVGVADYGGPARLGDDVYVGVGASILGELTVGDGCRIGAGAVVVSRDVPPRHVAVGVPARVRPLPGLG